MTDLDPYTALELPSTADYTEIRAAYATRVPRILELQGLALSREEELRREQAQNAFKVLVDEGLPALIDATERAAGLQDLDDRPRDWEEDALFDAFAVLRVDHLFTEDTDGLSTEDIEIDQAYIDKLRQLMASANTAQSTSFTPLKHMLALRHAYRELRSRSRREGTSDTRKLLKYVKVWSASWQYSKALTPMLTCTGSPT